MSCSECGPYLGIGTGVRILVRIGPCVHAKGVVECFLWCFCGGGSRHPCGFLVVKVSWKLRFLSVWFKESWFVPFVLRWRLRQVMTTLLRSQWMSVRSLIVGADLHRSVYASCLHRLGVSSPCARFLREVPEKRPRRMNWFGKCPRAFPRHKRRMAAFIAAQRKPCDARCGSSALLHFEEEN